MNSQFTAIDLFSGAGGFSLAAKTEGVEVLAAIEFDASAVKTYKTNLAHKGSSELVINDDINKVDIPKLRKELGIKKEELDLLLGGPPCQGFSSHRILDAGVDDPRNTLLLKYFDFVKVFKPKAFLLENVPGLLWKKHEKYLKKFIELTNSNSYSIVTAAPQIINAKNYGVPQNRRRAFVFAIRNDLYSENIIWPPKPTHFDRPNEGSSTTVAASTVFEKPPKAVLDELKSIYIHNYDLEKNEAFKLVDSLVFGKKINKSDPCNIHMNHSPELTKRFESTRLNGSREDSNTCLPCHRDYKGHKDVYGRIIFHKPSNTITTGCNNPSKGRFVHPWLHHGITLRHAARLQTFPDDFIFLGNNTEQARQIGNAVPVKLGQILIKEIKSYLESASTVREKTA